MKCRLLVLLLLFPGLIWAQDEHDKAINAVCDQMLASISVEQGEPMNWDTIRSLFIPEARLTAPAVLPDTVVIQSVDLDVFQQSAPQSRIGFKEEMVKRKVHRFGNVAVVFEAYKAEVLSTGQKMEGVNMYQMVFDGSAWKIASIVWDEKRSNNPTIPESLFR